MPYYLREMADQPPQLWLIDEREATRLGVSNPQSSSGSYFSASEGKTVFEDIAERTPWFEQGRSPFVKLSLDAGHYFPRIARPLAPSREPKLWSHIQDHGQVALVRSQMAILGADLERICRTIHPSEANFQAFGHDTRNLLILASTEVEMHFRGVLNANGAQKKQPTMADYVVLAEVMRLGEYVVSFPPFPWLTPIRPFAGWSRTTGLSWWSAYNGVKHNREAEFERGSLRHAFEAVAACYVLLIAQFGFGVGLRQVANLLHPQQVANWPAEESYCHDFEGDWKPEFHPMLSSIGLGNVARGKQRSTRA